MDHETGTLSIIDHDSICYRYLQLMHRFVVFSTLQVPDVVTVEFISPRTRLRKATAVHSVMSAPLTIGLLPRSSSCGKFRSMNPLWNDHPRISICFFAWRDCATVISNNLPPTRALFFALRPSDFSGR